MTDLTDEDSALALALRFHQMYERLAPAFCYKTQLATREFDPDSPNGKLMIAVCAEIGPEVLAAGRARAIEECAKVCEDIGKEIVCPEECAAAIRALKAERDTPATT